MLRTRKSKQKKQAQRRQAGRRCTIETFEDRRLLTIDMNGADPGVVADVTWTGTPVLIAPNATIDSSSLSQSVSSMTIQLDYYGPVLLSDGFRIASDALSGTAISQSGTFVGRLLLVGADTLANYMRVLRSVVYDDPDSTEAITTPEPFAVFTDYGQAGTGTITRPPMLSVSNSAGDGTTDIPFDITLDRPSASPSSVAYATATPSSGLPPAIPNQDYIPISGRVTFMPGETTKTISVRVLPRPPHFDSQQDKRFTVTLSAPSNATLAADVNSGSKRKNAEGIIYDNILTNPDPPRTNVLPDEVDMTLASTPLPTSIRTVPGTGDFQVTQQLTSGPLAQESELIYDSLSASPLSSTNVNREEILPYPRGTQFPDPGPSGPFYLRSGTYDWATGGAGGQHYPFADLSGANPNLYRHGIKTLVDRETSPYGAGWWVKGLDQLIIQDGFLSAAESGSHWQVMPKGITDILGNGTAAFFAYDPATGKYLTPHGYFLTLTRTDTGYLIESPQGEKKAFNGSGQLITVTDRLNNVVTYGYNSDGTLATIKDPFGHSATYSYASQRLTGFKDAAGLTTSVQINRAADARFFVPELYTLMSITGPAGVDGKALAESFTYAFQQALMFRVTNSVGGTFTIGSPSLYGPGRPSYTGQSPINVSHPTQPDDNLALVTIIDRGQASERVNTHGAAVEYTDFKGQTTKYDRDFNGLVTAITLPGKTSAQYRYFYDGKGNLTKSISAATDMLPEADETWSYDPIFNVPTSHTDSLGHKTIYDIDPSTGQFRSIQRVMGAVDGQGNTENDDLFTYFTYTAGGSGGVPAGLLASEKDPNGNETDYGYQITGGQFIKTTTQAVGRPEQTQLTDVFDFNTMNLVQSTDERLQTTSYQYDNLGELTQVAQPSPGSGQPAPITKYEYQKGLLSKAIDPRQNATTYDYYSTTDAVRTVTSPQAVAGESQSLTTYTYNDSTWVLGSVQDGLQHTTRYGYDPNNGKLDFEGESPTGAPNGSFWFRTYNALNLLDSEIDPNGNTTNYAYDDRGQLLSVTGPPDNDGVRPVTKYAYDNAGRLVSVTDPMLRVTLYQYDDANRLRVKVEPNPAVPGELPSVTTYDYDKNGNLRFETVDRFGLNLVTERQYDALNRLVKVFAPAPFSGAPRPETDYTYYPTGELYTETDPDGNTTTYNRDFLGRVTSRVDALGQASYFQYDANGNLTQSLDRDGHQIDYVYDALNQKRQETWSFQSNVTNVVTYNYDLAGRMTGASDSSSAYTFGYDFLDRQTSAIATLPNLPASVTLTSGYDDNGNRTSLTTTIGAGSSAVPDFKNAYAYDHLNRLTSVQQFGQSGGHVVAPKEADFLYNLDGQLSELDRFAALADPNASPMAYSFYGYDGAGRLTGFSNGDQSGN